MPFHSIYTALLHAPSMPSTGAAAGGRNGGAEGVQEDGFAATGAVGVCADIALVLPEGERRVKTVLMEPIQSSAFSGQGGVDIQRIVEVWGSRDGVGGKESVL